MKYLTVVLGLFLVSGSPAQAFYQINIIFNKTDFASESSGAPFAKKAGKDTTKMCPCEHPSPQWFIGFTNPMG